MRWPVVLTAAMITLAAAPAAAAPPKPAPGDRLQWQLGDLPAGPAVDVVQLDGSRS